MPSDVAPRSENPRHCFASYRNETHSNRYAVAKIFCKLFSYSFNTFFVHENSYFKILLLFPSCNQGRIVADPPSPAAVRPICSGAFIHSFIRCVEPESWRKRQSM